MPRNRSRSRSRSPTPKLSLKELGVSEISEADYFRKSSEFRAWLRDERDKYFDELSGERARHSYFRKFVKAWNKGKLSKELYTADAALESARPAASQTSYRWSFATNSKVSAAELKAAREAVSQATYDRDAPPTADTAPKRTQGPPLPSGRTHGPALPSASDRTLEREAAAEAAQRDRRAANKRTRERLEDEDGGIGPKAVGREGMMEKKRARREEDRAMSNRKEDGGLEMSEDVLMGSGSSDSFQAAIARRDAAKARWAEKKAAANGGSGAPNERLQAMRAREAETMAMFQNMVKERYG
ncbi:hypothetical protein CTheo_3758 [Ceratobasidium theobromae]|uniref:Uncharacterized protein n=1 Tax=Ceratobasidium theobromae TaxID=1582974 RepID=A0A5N5QM72_9AGAM|nr:hypothetical protein CTheo_3758 [Ceratobasidium theobromae]